MKRMTMEKNLKVPNGVIICGKNTYFTKDAYKSWNNNNILVVGTSGGGKTRCMVEPALLQAEGSYVISDPKGKLYKDYANYLKSKGYKVVKMDFIHPEKSLHYNPLQYCNTTQDIQKLAQILVYSLDGGFKADPFWDEATHILLSALVGLLVESCELQNNSISAVREKTFNRIRNLLINAGRVQRLGEDTSSIVKKIFEKHDRDYRMKFNKSSWAKQRFDEVLLAAGRTYDSICISLASKLSLFATEEIREMMSKNEIDFMEPGRNKMAIFVEVSDSDRSMDSLVNLFYTQFMNVLCSYADEQCAGNRLEIPVQFILDDFATNVRIQNFENMISNIRSRNISAMLMVQSESQLAAGYRESAGTIVNNCSTYVYLGGTDPDMAATIARRVNISAHTVLTMPVEMCYVCRRGQDAVYTEHFDLPWFEKEKGFIRGQACTKKPIIIVRGKKER